MEDSKIATRTGSMFSDLTMVKMQQDSGITITNRNWNIVVDQYIGYKESEFYTTKSNFVEWMCKKART